MAEFVYPRADAGSISQRIKDDETLAGVAEYVFGQFSDGKGVWVASTVDADEEDGTPVRAVLTYVPPTASVSFEFDGVGIPEDLRIPFDALAELADDGELGDS